MIRNVSSIQTFLVKWIFPLFWILIFGYGTVMLWLNKFDQPQQVDAIYMKLLFLIIFIVGTTTLAIFSFPLKRVRMDSKYLYISNFLTEIRVPFTSISDVTENRWINTHPVTVHFRTSTQFGRKIVFMPTARWFAFLSSHPIVAELRKVAGLGAT